jgi:Spy/CpxP family protein refolding chaperone
MSDPSHVATPTGTRPPQDRWTRRRTAIVVLVAILAVGLTGAFATGAFSHGFGFGPRHHFGSMSPAAIEDRADRMVRHAAIEIDATAEQQERLRALVRAAVRDLLPMREKARAARAQARELLTNPSIDRAEIERFRTEQLALVDAASRRLVQALADAAEILTPEQRSKINDHLERRDHWRSWRRG